MSTSSRLRIWTAVIIFVVLFLLARFGVGLYTDYLWFAHLDFESVMVISIWSRLVVGVAVALPFAALFLINTLVARWQSVRSVLFFSEETLVAQSFVVYAIWGVGLFLAWLVGMAASNDWLLFLRFYNQEAFNLVDPIFNRDVSFYVFSLPVYRFIQTWLVICLFLSLIGTVVIYALAQYNNLIEGRLVVLPYVQLHLSVLGALIFLAFAFDHWLDLFDLMYSDRGVAFGASYTDVHVLMTALWVRVVVALVVALLLLANTFIRRPAVSLLAVFVWIIVGIIGTGFIPGVVQRYVVEPNELARETPYIESNIRLTNLAYGLDQVQERDFSQVEPLTQVAVEANDNFLKNIRLWDYRPLEQTYQQIQAIRLYYQFADVDFDRYIIDGELRQIALSARELEKSQLQSQTWVTERLQFTHGYGVVANPVNEVTREGLPRLWIKDLPPVSTVDLTVSRPEIYYGETNDDYVFVNTNEREFNYPSGDQNVFTNYEGRGGVVLDSSLKRLAFALRLSDANMLLSTEFTPDSRVMIYRNIQERTRRVAPFLLYDNDPYIVIGPEGHLYWIQDAYTTSNRFPYAQPITFQSGEATHRINYIRNSVKIVIDAYDGSMTFYVVEPEDPLIRSYQTIFPKLFTPMSEMPAWVRDHMRYPEDIFRIQSTLYRTYHMRDVNVFYNKEDLWEIPEENFGGTTQPVEPYYVTLKLPDTDGNEFVLIQPFTPNNRDNLIGWMAARSDGENYGELVTYRFPKQELIFGPLQIEARIDQDPEISAQITLWDQGGSEVIRGNLLVLPIENSLLYVEPLYLRAENGQIPELKRVILSTGDRIVMRETLSQALIALFEDQEDEGPVTTSPPPAELSEAAEIDPTTVDAPPLTTTSLEELRTKNISELAQLASDHYAAAQRALQRGDWTTSGNELDSMEEALNTLVELTAATP
ncbi:MAG TPA: UPF0182 family protein, partial [Anaerolineae bacterium]|nr:UPF0182 family protein [Anaerolineae bacterium]